MKSLIKKLKRSSLLSGAGVYFGTSVINASIPFFMLPVLTRFLEPSEYGEVAVFTVWVSLISAICGLSVHGAAARKYYDFEDPDEHIGEFTTACLLLLISSTLVVLLVILPLAPWISGILGLSKQWVVVGVGFAFCNFLISLRMGQWQVRKEPLKYGSFQISRSILDVSLSLMLVVSLTLGVTGRITGMTAAAMLFAAIALHLLYRDGLIKRSWRPDYMKEAASFGVPLIPHILGAFLLLTIDRAVIGAVLGLESAGFYMVAAQIAGILNIVLDSFNKAYVPWLYERLKQDQRDEKLFVVKLTYIYYLALLVIAGVAFLFGGSFLTLVAGESYAPAAEIVAWLVLGQCFRGMYLMVTSYIFYARRTKYLAMVTISSGILNIVIMFPLLQYYGVLGAAYAFCISMFLQFVFVALVARRLVSMPWGLKV